MTALYATALILIGIAAAGIIGATIHAIRRDT